MEHRLGTPALDNITSRTSLNLGRVKLRVHIYYTLRYDRMVGSYHILKYPLKIFEVNIKKIETIRKGAGRELFCHDKMVIIFYTVMKNKKHTIF